MITEWVQAHDILGAGILLTLAAASYAWHWTQLRRESNLEPLPDPIAVAIAFHARPTGEVLVDHDRCDECGTVICRCRVDETPDPVLCADTIGLGCVHGRSLCVVCNGACLECLQEMAEQGVLSQHAHNGWWTS